jgi:hypothetical protein
MRRWLPGTLCTRGGGHRRCSRRVGSTVGTRGKLSVGPPHTGWGSWGTGRLLRCHGVRRASGRRRGPCSTSRRTGHGTVLRLLLRSRQSRCRVRCGGRLVGCRGVRWGLVGGGRRRGHRRRAGFRPREAALLLQDGARRGRGRDNGAHGSRSCVVKKKT